MKFNNPCDLFKFIVLLTSLCCSGKTGVPISKEKQPCFFRKERPGPIPWQTHSRTVYFWYYPADSKDTLL